MGERAALPPNPFRAFRVNRKALCRNGHDGLAARLSKRVSSSLGLVRMVVCDRGLTALQSGSAGTGNPVENGNSVRSEEHTSELQSLMRISYAVFCLKKKKRN